MAGSKLATKHQVRASSILEVIIAMVVIVIVLSIAMGITGNVSRLALSAKKLKAQGILRGALSKIIPDEATRQTFTVEGIRIEQEVKIYKGNSLLHEIDLAAYDDNQEKIAEIKSVVYGK